GEVARICDSLVAIDGGRLLRSDHISAMTSATDVLSIEVSEGGDELAARLADLGLPVRREGALLLVPLADPGTASAAPGTPGGAASAGLAAGPTPDRTYDLILTAVAELDLPLHRLDQRRHRVAELFASTEASHV
ncbi:MAG TPA: hypothetical protein VGD43_03690, partial [Micromonospora sp.]